MDLNISITLGRALWASGVDARSDAEDICQFAGGGMGAARRGTLLPPDAHVQSLLV